MKNSNNSTNIFQQNDQLHFNTMRNPQFSEDNIEMQNNISLENTGTASPYTTLLLNMDKLKLVDPENDSGFKKFDDASLDVKMRIIVTTNRVVEDSSEYKKIDKNTCKNMQKDAAKVIENLEGELTSILKNNKHKESLVRQILIEFGYNISKLQYGNAGFLKGLTVTLDDNIGVKK